VKALLRAAKAGAAGLAAFTASLGSVATAHTPTLPDWVLAFVLGGTAATAIYWVPNAKAAAPAGGTLNKP
jgi:hypothetical protein